MKRTSSRTPGRHVSGRTATGAALIAAALALPGLAGCSSTGSDDDDGVEISLATQEEADAAAKARITAKNADDEFEKLSEEIDADG